MAELALDRGLDVLRKRASRARAMLFAFIVASGLAIFANFAEATGRIDLAADNAASLIGLLIYALYLLVLLGSVVLVGMWIYRAHANLRAAGHHDLAFTPGWAVGWYFVPIANLFKPIEAMRELWTTSLMHAAAEGADGRLGYWWGAWIVGNILSNIGVRLESSMDGGLVLAGYGLDALGSLVLIGAAWLLAAIIRQVTAAQQDVMAIAGVFE